MRTLLERLKPEVLQAINYEVSKYPNSIISLKKSLSEEYFTGDLTVRVAFNVCLYNKTNFGIVELANCFESE
jgi:hypothetical protein